MPWVKLRVSSARRVPAWAGGPVVQDRGQIRLGEPAMHRGVPERGVDLVGAEQPGQFHRLGHLHPIRVVPASAARSATDRHPAQSPGTPTRRRCPVVVCAQGAFGCGREMPVVDPGAARVARRCRATSTGPGIAEMGDHDLLTVPGPVARTQTVAPSSWWGTEYCPDSKLTIGVVDRDHSGDTVPGGERHPGSRCSRVRSSASMSTGQRFVTRCGGV